MSRFEHALEEWRDAICKCKVKFLYHSVSRLPDKIRWETLYDFLYLCQRYLPEKANIETVAKVSTIYRIQLFCLDDLFNFDQKIFTAEKRAD